MLNLCFNSHDVCHCVVWAICHLSFNFCAVDNYFPLSRNHLHLPEVHVVHLVPPVHSMKETFNLKNDVGLL